jgi:ParB/RepB/Spo0J family partition protein
MSLKEYAADAGTAVADQDEPATPSPIPTAPIHDGEISEIAAVPLAAIQASPFNPRQIHNAAADAELAESVRQVGVLEPVLLRPLPYAEGDNPFGDEQYELVFGHRRWLAAKAAGLESIPAMIRTLSDADSAQLQAIENLQREDLTAMDEARGYAAFIATHGINKDQLAERLGKSRTHVYNRLKLAALVPEAAKALLDGKLTTSTAEQIARIPAKHQVRALAVAMETFPHATTRSFRKVRDELLEKLTLDLKTAIFDTADAVLLELAGACTTCPKRSGQTPELYGDIIRRDEPLYKWGKSQHGSADICTDPDCFAEKKKAHLANQRKALEVKGATVVAGSAAMAAVDAQGNVKGSYIALSEVRAELAKLKKNPRKSLAGVDLDPPTVVTIQNPRDGTTIQAVKRADLADAGAKVEKHAKAQDRFDEARKRDAKARAENEAKAKVLTERHLALLATVRDAAAQVPRTAFDLQLIARVAWAGVEYRDRQVLARLHGFTHHVDLGKRIGSMDVDALGRFCLDCALVHDVQVNSYSLKQQPENLMQAAKHYGVEVVWHNAVGVTPEQALADAVEGEDGDD